MAHQHCVEREATRALGARVHERRWLETAAAALSSEGRQGAGRWGPCQCCAVLWWTEFEIGWLPDGEFWKLLSWQCDFVSVMVEWDSTVGALDKTHLADVSLVYYHLSPYITPLPLTFTVHPSQRHSAQGLVPSRAVSVRSLSSLTRSVHTAVQCSEKRFSSSNRMNRFTNHHAVHMVLNTERFGQCSVLDCSFLSTTTSSAREATTDKETGEEECSHAEWHVTSATQLQMCRCYNESNVLIPSFRLQLF